MGRISRRSVVLGGLLAGVILNAGEMLFHWLILGADWWFFKALSRPIQEAGEIVRYLGLNFLTGTAAIWLYAVARARFGPGPKTAVYTALGYWGHRLCPADADLRTSASLAPLVAGPSCSPRLGDWHLGWTRGDHFGHGRRRLGVQGIAQGRPSPSSPEYLSAQEVRLPALAFRTTNGRNMMCSLPFGTD